MDQSQEHRIADSKHHAGADLGFYKGGGGAIFKKE